MKYDTSMNHEVLPDHKKPGVFTFFQKIFQEKRSVVICAVLVLILGLYIWKNWGTTTVKSTYQTARVERGTLVVSVASSGQVATTNAASISTQASGVVTRVFVIDGQEVKMGDQIAQIDLDLLGKQRNAQAYASYQNAKNTLASAQATNLSLQATMFSKWDTFKELAQTSTYSNSDKSPNFVNRALPEFHIPEKEWLAAEAQYKNQQNVISAAQTSLNSAWLSYQQSSPIIYSPISGKVTGLSLQVGSVLTTQTSTTGTTTSQKIASIKTTALPSVIVNLTEIDVPKVKIGNKATLTFDALQTKTFTGKIVSVDTIGTVSSGVTNYQAVIGLDSDSPEILSNMTGQAKIITQVKDDVLMVPASALHSQNGQTTVSILKNGVVTEKQVETGRASASEVEIVSGVNEGDTVITGSSTTATQKRSTNQTQSPFSALGGFNGRQGGQIGQGRFGGGTRPVSGEIISIDDTSVTVKLTDGSSKIVLISEKTAINKASEGSKSDLQKSMQIAAFGTENSDGSITASNIQINPQFGGMRNRLTPTPS